MLRDGMYDLAFRYEATYHISTFYDQGGDTVRLHQLRSSSDRRSWVDGEDLGVFAIQNVLNAHEHPLGSCGVNAASRPPTRGTPQR
jgi:hypothetical protein